MKKQKIICRLAAAGIIAALVLTGSAAAKKPDITWKTAKHNSVYCTTFKANGKKICTVKTKKRLPVKIMAADKVTYKTISHRKNNYILIEKYRGQCVNDYGDGETIINGHSYYISYHKTTGHKYGKKYLTYCIHENDNAPDGIKARADFPIK